MKKIMVLLLTLAMLTMCACTTNLAGTPDVNVPEPGTNTEVEQNVDLAEMDADKLAETMKPLLDAYSSVLAETFGTQYSEQSYIRLFEDEDSAIANDLANVKVIIPATDVKAEDGKQKGGEYDGLVIDPSYGDCYPVSNFKSVDEVKAYLGQWLDESVFVERMNYNFIEFDGTLYMVRGGRGYGESNIDVNSLKLVEAVNGGWTLTVDGYMFGEKTDNVTLTVTADESGVLRITNAVWESIK